MRDNLSTHTPAALYEAFEPAEASRLAGRFEWHYTPKHGSWLNLAEMELSVVARQCLDPDLRPGDAVACSGALATDPKPGRGEGGLAIHHSRRPIETQEALPYDSAAMNH